MNMPWNWGKPPAQSYQTRQPQNQQPIIGGVNQGQPPSVDVSRFVTLNDEIPDDLKNEMWYVALKDLSLTQITDAEERDLFIKRLEIQLLIDQANEFRIYVPDIYEKAISERNMAHYLLAARVNLSRSIGGKHVSSLTSATSKIETQNTTPGISIGENAVNAFFPK